MGSGDYFTTDILKQLHMSNVKEGCQSSNIVNGILLIFKYNEQCTGYQLMVGKLLYL